MLASGRASPGHWSTAGRYHCATMAGEMPVFQATCPTIAPPAGFRIVGQQVARASPSLQRAHGDDRQCRPCTSRRRRRIRMRR